MKRDVLLAGFILFFAPVICANAGWEVANGGPAQPTPQDPFFQSKIQQKTARPLPYHFASASTYPSTRTTMVTSKPRLVHTSTPVPIPAKVKTIKKPPVPPRVVAIPVSPIPVRPIVPRRPKGMYAVSISGSVKENLERIMSRYHWRVIWKAPYDYNFDGRITGKSLPNVIEKLMQPFPLQAVMYMSNRTLAVTSRPRYKA